MCRSVVLWVRGHTHAHTHTHIDAYTHVHAHTGSYTYTHIYMHPTTPHTVLPFLIGWLYSPYVCYIDYNQPTKGITASDYCRPCVAHLLRIARGKWTYLDRGKQWEGFCLLALLPRLVDERYFSSLDKGTRVITDTCSDSLFVAPAVLGLVLFNYITLDYLCKAFSCVLACNFNYCRLHTIKLWWTPGT